MAALGGDARAEDVMAALRAAEAAKPAPVAAPAIAPTVAMGPSPGERTLAVLNLHTGEKIKATYFEGGRYLSDAVSAVSKVLRDYRTGEAYPIDPKVLDIMAGLNSRLGAGNPIQIICGYRSPKTNAMLAARSGEVAKHSLHMDGKAVDLRLQGVDLSVLHKAAMDIGRGGVGFYPVSNFVHVDSGRVRSWRGT